VFDNEAFRGPRTVWMTGVTAGDHGLVAVGWREQKASGGREGGVIWASADGRDWDLITGDLGGTHEEGVTDTAVTSEREVVAGGPGYVMVG